MKCKQCGAKLLYGSQSCPSCNTPVIKKPKNYRILFMLFLVLTLIISISSAAGYIYMAYQTRNALDESRESGRLSGIEEGIALGKEEGYSIGFEAGKANGFLEGKEAGIVEGIEKGITEGAELGRQEGYATGKLEGIEEGISQGKEIINNEEYLRGHHDGYLEGVTTGFDPGYASGREAGYNAGKAEGFNEGRESGKAESNDEAYRSGYEKGYEQGYLAAKEEVNSEPAVRYLYKNGTFTGTARGMGGNITVTITIKDDVITVDEITGPYETPGVGGKEAIEDGTYKDQIEKAQSFEIEGVAGATMTSGGVSRALKDALTQAYI